MFPERLVASDATKNDRGSFFNLIGVAIEFNDYPEFREEYFNIVEETSDKYKVKLPKIVKTKDITNYVPSYDIRDFIKELVTKLLASEYLTKVQVTETYLSGEVEVWRKGSLERISASQFVRDDLHHYYALVPVWKYVLNSDSDIVRSFVIDNVSGKINRVWKTVGKTAEILYLVPHGDQTHPCISLCDLLCTYIKREIYPQKAREIYEHLKNNFEVFVNSDFVGDSEVDSLTPKFSYPIRPENHFPHPIIFIKSSSIKDKTILEDTELFKLALQYAEMRGGCVTLPDVVNHQKIMREGDIVICVDDTSYHEMKNIIDLN